MHDREVSLERVVDVFGGFSNLARLLKIPTSTCHGWARRGSLPEWRAEQITKLARREKVKLKDIFVDKKKKRGRPRKVN